jgi:hypothetical protein
MKNREKTKRDKERRRRRRKQKEAKRQEIQRQRNAKKRFEHIIVGQVKQASRPTFQRSSWQAPSESNNTPPDNQEDGVLEPQKGFNMTAWKPPDE